MSWDKSDLGFLILVIAAISAVIIFVVGINVATIFKGGITRIAPDKSGYEFFETDDLLTTNICFGGDDLKTAYITLSSTGRLVKTDWNISGHKLNF